MLSVEQRPGKFFFEGGDLARAWPGDRVDDELADAIRGAFYFGPRRTLTQDVEFAIDQLVEVAVRALSPGVNDPFTAINCVDRLGAALCSLADEGHPLALPLRRGGPAARRHRRLDGRGDHRRLVPPDPPGRPRGRVGDAPAARDDRRRRPPHAATRSFARPCGGTPTRSTAAARRDSRTRWIGRTPTVAIAR